MSLLRSGIIVAGLTLLSRIFGLLRDQFIAMLFGCDSIADSVNLAWKLPNLFRRILGEGALSSVFIPIFNHRIRKSKEDGEKFINQIYILLFFTLLIIVGIFEYFMPEFLHLLAPGFKNNTHQFKLTILLCRITLPYLWCISQVALFGAILNSVNRFAAFSFVPVLLNIGVIGFTLLLKNYISSAQAISYSIVISGVLQLIFMYICFRYANFRISKFSFSFDSHVKKFLFGMGPATLSSGVVQLQLFISQSIASFIPGGIAILSYADRLYQLPLSIIGTTFSTILLPLLVNKSQNKEDIFLLKEQSIQWGLILSLPCSMGLVVLSHPIIHIIYERGMFTALDSINVAKTMQVFSFGLPAFILVKILTPFFYAHQDVNTPFKISLIILIVNTGLNILLMHYYSYIGIAIGSVLASWFHVGLLLGFLYKKINFFLSKKLILFLSIITVITAFIGIILHYCFQIFIKDYYYSNNFIIKLCILSTLIIITACSYLLIIYIKLLKNTKIVL